jgi:hypothetical protein
MERVDGQFANHVVHFCSRTSFVQPEVDLQMPAESKRVRIASSDTECVA